MSSQSTLQLALSKLPDFVLNPNPEIYLSDNYAVIDFETTNLDKGSATDPRNRLLLTVCRLGPDHPQFRKWPAGRLVVPKSEFEQEPLKQAIGQADFLVAHNAKFELQWLKRAGLSLRSVLPYCTQIGEYVIAGNRRVPLGLDATARRYGLGAKLSLVSAMIKGGVCPSDIPPDKLLEYCDEDVRLTEAIFLEQRSVLSRMGLLPVHYCRNLFTPVLADIEFEGMQLDKERVSDALESIRGQFGRAKRRLDELSGGINQNSPKQVREFLYDKLKFDPPKDYKGNPIKTPKGELAVGKQIIGKLEATTPKQEEFLDALRLVVPLKKKIQLLETMQQCCEEDNGKVFATFNQTVAQTHRLSSTGRKWGFQFHNFPRSFKPLFCARELGSVLVEGDSPQLEFRVAVELGSDARGMRAICEGVDVHELTSKVMRLDRTAAKAYTFKPLYGGTSGTTVERRYYEAFRQEYAGVYNTQRGWTYKVLADKSLRIESGLIFYWPDTKITGSGFITNTPSIFNYPVQSFATADIVPLCVIAVWHRISEQPNIRILNTVHDSVVAEVPEDMLYYYREVLKEAFTKDVYTIVERLYGRKISVPLGVGIKAAKHWGEGKEEKLDAVDKIEAYLSSNLGDNGRRTGG